jgi:hypothetical protein
MFSDRLLGRRCQRARSPPPFFPLCYLAFPPLFAHGYGIRIGRPSGTANRRPESDRLRPDHEFQFWTSAFPSSSSPSVPLISSGRLPGRLRGTASTADRPRRSHVAWIIKVQYRASKVSSQVLSSCCHGRACSARLPPGGFARREPLPPARR